MTTRLLKRMLLCMLMVFMACIDEYDPEITSYQNLLAVDGMITNGPGPFRVDLSLSTRVDLPQYKPYGGCEVSIVDDLGGIIDLKEEDEGSYISPGTGEEGKIGRSYKLLIKTPSGKQYASEFDELLTPATIDSVFPVLETKVDPLYDYDLIGYQFYVNTKTETQDPVHYFWKLTQTYEYNADFLIYFIFDGTTEPFYPVDSLYTCWKTENVNQIFVFGTSGLTSPNLNDFPLNYVSTETRELTVRYSLLVDQLTVGEKTYEFWNDVREQNAGETSLYTQQLYQIRGNMKNISDEQEPVLGYFTVAGKDSRRIFVDRPQELLEFHYSYCLLTEGAYEAYGFIRWTDKKTWPLYVYRDPNGARALLQQVCMDCREKEGTINKPAFWTDSKK